jgi:hypothetical protein
VVALPKRLLTVVAIAKEKFTQAAQNFMHSNTLFFPDRAGKKRFALWANSRN